MSQLGYSRHSRHPDMSGSLQERTFDQCLRQPMPANEAMWLAAKLGDSMY